MQAARGGFRAIVWFVPAALLLPVCWCSLRLSLADHLARGSADDVLRAARLAPGDADYYAAWARLYDQPGRDPNKVRWALEKAVSINPRLSSAWIDLGLRSEAERNFEAAEAFLLRASLVDRTWRPRWTLANYYYRRGDTARLLEWTHKALEIADVRLLNPDPLFALCWNAAGDPALIRERAIPDRAAVHARYSTFLLAYCDSRLQARDVSRALEVWNELCTGHFVPYSRLDPARGASLTNGDFSAAPLSHGFDWRVPTVAGVSATWSSGGMRLEFDGDQPESCDVLVQMLPVLAGHRYVLRLRYVTAGIPVHSGLRWRTGGGTGPEVAGDSAQGSFEFSTPPSDRLAQLTLSYQRPLGRTRFAGSILISRVELDSAE